MCTLHANVDACNWLSTELSEPPLLAESAVLLRQLDDFSGLRHMIVLDIEQCPGLNIAFPCYVI